MKTQTCPWDQRQVRAFVREAVNSVGGPKAWAFLGVSIQRSIIEAKLTQILVMQLDDTSLLARDVKSLWRAMMNESNLWEE